MQNQSLNGYWQVRRAGTQDWLPACVPGSVHTDLMAAGKLPDPFTGDNEVRVQWVAEKNWEYRRYFYPLPALFRQEKIWLVCDGLDTLADIRLNGKILGQADNMFRSWRWEIKDLLREGENRLEILFRSPLAFIRARQRVKPVREMGMGIPGGPHLRKAASHFGWDWGPRLPAIGIWKDIRLEGKSHGQLGEIHLDQEHAAGIVTLTARVQCVLWDPGEARHTLRVRISGPDPLERQVWQLDAPARPNSTMTVTIANPQLWWPNGYGEPTLYGVDVELLGGEGELLDRRSCAIGLRTLELRQGEDSFGRSFTLEVNGQPIFCKGANWIPPDSFPARVTPERLENLLRSAADANFNLLRVWGGGYYESDVFYDLCDRYGLLVWQDLAFACATAPLDDPAYLENARAEVIETAQRLRHHASLALWCGSNEVEELGLQHGWFDKDLLFRAAFERFFYQELPELFAREDPRRPYWPGSPSSGQAFKNPGSESSGDAHLWAVYHGYRPAEYYRQQNPRFASEFGFQSLPDLTTVERFAAAQQRRLDSPVMASHQRAAGGNAKLFWYLARRFRLPRRFEDMVYLSQVLQAETVRTGVEHWRRHPERTSGALYWQLNDCWPGISWSSIDYYGRWKALHYAARRFYAPVLLSLEEHLEGGRREVDVWVSSDLRGTWTGHLHWTLETLDGEVIEGGDQQVLCAPGSAQRALRLNFARHKGRVDWRRAVLAAELRQDGGPVALRVLAFVAEKHMPLPDPELRAEVSSAGERARVRVSARRLARFVELRLEGASSIFSDNFFDLPAGRAMEVECSLPAGWTAEQLGAALRVRALNTQGPSLTGVSAAWKSAAALVSSVASSLWQGIIRPRLSR